MLGSLSKSAASCGLDASEVALLLFGLMLVVGIIGEYTTSPTWRAHLRKFEILVTIGVAGELIADGGIFVFSRHLQAISDKEVAELGKIAAEANEKAEREALARAKVEKRVASLRQLALESVHQGIAENLWTDSEDRARSLKQLGVYMDSFPGTELFIQPVPDFHIQKIADRIADMMRRHGWIVRIVDESFTSLSPMHIPPGLQLQTWNPSDLSFEIDANWIDTAPGWLAALLLYHHLGMLLGLKHPGMLRTDPICSDSSLRFFGFELPANGVFLTMGLLGDADPFEVAELAKASEDDSAP